MNRWIQRWYAVCLIAASILASLPAAFFISSEWISITGFMGSVASLVGLLIVAVELIETKQSSQRTEIALTELNSKLVGDFYQRLLEQTITTTHEIEILSDSATLKLRLRDLHRSLTAMAHRTEQPDIKWIHHANLADEWFRYFDQTTFAVFKKCAEDKESRNRWLGELNRQLIVERGPFAGRDDNEGQDSHKADPSH